VEAYLKRTPIAGLNGDAKSSAPANLHGAEQAVLKFLHARESDA